MAEVSIAVSDSEGAPSPPHALVHRATSTTPTDFGTNRSRSARAAIGHSTKPARPADGRLAGRDDRGAQLVRTRIDDLTMVPASGSEAPCAQTDTRARRSGGAAWLSVATLSWTCERLETRSRLAASSSCVS